MEPGHRDVETAQRLVVDVEAAIPPDVQLCALQHDQIGELCTDLLDLPSLLFERRLIEAAEPQAGRVIGDQHVFVSPPDRLEEDLSKAHTTVRGFFAMNMQVASNVVEPNDVRCDLGGKAACWRRTQTRFLRAYISASVIDSPPRLRINASTWPGGPVAWSSRVPTCAGDMTSTLTSAPS